MTSARPRLLDVYCGEGGAGVGYDRAGWDVEGVDNSPARLRRYPFTAHQADAVEFILEHGGKYDAIHASPVCTGYSRGTVAIPDRVARYSRLIAATRAALKMTGRPYVIENVEGAKSELVNPVMLCGYHFGLTAVDTDGTFLQLERHRLFECSLLHDDPFLFAGLLPCNHDPDVQVAGSYGGARRDKDEARNVRKGGYVPKSVDVQRELLGTPWMSEKGCQLSIPPAYSQFIGGRMLEHLSTAAGMTPDLRAYLSRQPGRCPDCCAHIATQGHTSECPRTRPGSPP